MKIALAAILIASPVFAGAPLDPPARFDHEFSGNLTIYRVNRANVQAECSDGGRLAVRKDVAGCAISEGNDCTIYLAMKTRRAPIEAILRHEIAHCNGWPANHPE